VRSSDSCRSRAKAGAFARAVWCFGGGLNLNLHDHTLLLDGVFLVDRVNGTLGFRPLPPPTGEEVGAMLARIL
jgi:hypothetical protein